MVSARSPGTGARTQVGAQSSCRWHWTGAGPGGCPPRSPACRSRPSGAGPGAGSALGRKCLDFSQACGECSSPYSHLLRAFGSRASCVTPWRHPEWEPKLRKRRLEVTPESGGCGHPSCFRGRGPTGLWALRTGGGLRSGVLGNCWLTAASGSARRLGLSLVCCRERRRAPAPGTAEPQRLLVRL